MPARIAFAAAAALTPCSHALGGAPPANLLTMSLEDLGKIDVSAASLLPASLLSTASSITSVTPQDWERSGARRTLDALEGIPGAFVMPHSNGNQVLAIRGYARLTSFTGVAVTLDGVPLTDLYRSSPQYNFPGLNLGAMSQIQLIQGPGSALYGSDAFHGMLALRTQGGEELAREASLAGGNNDYFEVAARHSDRIGDSWWSLSAAANGQGNQDRIASRANPTGGAPIEVRRENRFQAQTAVLKTGYKNASGWTFQGGVYLHSYEADNFQGLGSRLAGAQDLGGLDTRFLMVQGSALRSFGDSSSLELKAYGWRVDNDLAGRLQLPSGGVWRDLYSQQDRIGIQAIYRDAIPTLRTEWALAVASERLNVRDVHVALHTLAGTQISDTPNAASNAQRQVRSATLELNTRLNQNWRAVYGGRMDNYSDFGGHGSPRLGLIWQPDERGALKLLYGQAFRAPSAAERNGTVNTVLGNPGLKPEVINSLELVGIRQVGNWQLQGNAFKSIWRDGITIVFRPELRINQFQNLERNKAHGVSANVAWQYEAWQAQFGAAWVTSRNAGNGSRYRLYPSTTLNASLARNFEGINGQLGGTIRWMNGFDDIPRGDIYLPSKLPSYVKADLTYRQVLSKTSTVVLSIRNLFDRDSRLPSPLGSVGGIPDERLSLAVRANWHFN